MSIETRREGSSGTDYKTPDELKRKHRYGLRGGAQRRYRAGLVGRVYLVSVGHVSACDGPRCYGWHAMGKLDFSNTMCLSRYPVDNSGVLSFHL